MRTNCVGTMFMYVTRSASMRPEQCFGVESLHQHDGLRRRERLQRVAMRRPVVEREAREVHFLGTGETPEVEQRRVRTRAVRLRPGAGGADDRLGSPSRARGVHALGEVVRCRRALDRRVRLLGDRALVFVTDVERADRGRRHERWARSRAAPRPSRRGGSRARRWSSATTPAPAALRAARVARATSTHSGRLPSTVAAGASGPTPCALRTRASRLTRAVELAVGDAAIAPDQRRLLRVGCRRAGDAGSSGVRHRRRITFSHGACRGRRGLGRPT